MAILFVQGTGGNFQIGTPTTILFNGVATHNLVVVHVDCQANGSTLPHATSVTDGVNTYVQATGSLFQSNGSSAEIWYAKDVTGGNLSIVVHYNVSSGAVNHIQEFSGADLTNPIQSASGVSGNPAVGPIGPNLVATTGTEMLVTSQFVQSLGGSPVSPWTSSDSGALSASYSAGYYAPGTPGTYHCTFSATLNQDFASTGAVIKQASSGPSNATLTGAFLVF